MRTTGTRGFGLIAALGTLLVAGPVLGSVYLPIEDGVLARRAPAVAVVQSLGSDVDLTKGMPVTRTAFAVLQPVKGELALQIEVRTPGGENPTGMSLEVEGIPRFEAGRVYLLMLQPRGDGTYGLAELGLGAFDVLRDAALNRYATRQMFRASPLPVAGTMREPIRDLAGFVEFLEASAGPSALAAPASYVREPKGELVPEVGSIKPLWNSSWSGQQVRWNPSAVATVNTSDEYPTTPGQSGVAGAGGGTQLEIPRAIAHWTDDANSDITYAKGNDGVGKYDPGVLPGAGEVVVYLDNLSEWGGVPVTDCTGGFSGSIAIGGWLTDGTTHTHKRGTWRTAKAGIAWVRNVACDAGSFPSNVFENVVTNLLGNTLGLTNNPQPLHPADVVSGDEGLAVMQNVQDKGRPAGLGSDDKDAICFLYGVCDPLAPPVPPVADFTFAPSPAKVGVAVQFQDASTNSPTSWAWAFGDTTASNERNPLKTYTAPGFFNVDFTATNGGGSSSKSKQVTVQTNLAATLTGPGKSTVGQFVTFTLRITAGTAKSARVEYGDGTGETVAITGSVTNLSHLYPNIVGQLFNVTAWVTDVGAPSGASGDPYEILVSTTHTLEPVACVQPLAPTVEVPPSMVASGSDLQVMFMAAPVDPLVGAGDQALVEVSPSAAFGAGTKSYVGFQSNISLPLVTVTISVPGTDITEWALAGAKTLYIRGRIVRPCFLGDVPFSTVKQTTLEVAPPIVTLTAGLPQPMTYQQGSIDVISFFAELGNSPASIGTTTVTLTTPPGSFFTLGPTSFPLPPGGRTGFTLTLTQAAIATPGPANGFFTVTYTVPGGTATFDIAVSLNVIPPVQPPPPPPPFLTLTSSLTAPPLTFSAQTGQQPPDQQVTVTVSPLPTVLGEFTLEKTLVPNWVTVTASCPAEGSADVRTLCTVFKFPPSGNLVLNYRVDRSRRDPANLGAPQSAQSKLQIPLSNRPELIIPLLDVEPLPVESGAGGDLGFVATAGEKGALAAPVGGSFAIPSVVEGKGLFDAQFYTDGWMKNVTSLNVPVSIYYIPEGKNGITDPGVLKVTVTLAAGETLRFAHVLRSLFGLAEGNGRLEIRSPMPAALTIRSTVEAQTGASADLRFGAEVPTVGYGLGIGKNDKESLIPGISSDDNNRANLILTETIGKQVTVSATLYDAAGTSLGTLEGKVVPPMSKIQVNGIAEAIKPGVVLSGGSIGLKVTDGDGRLVGIATVIDNRSNSFSTAQAQPTPTGVIPSSTVIPAVARTTGLYNTVFKTALNIVNGSASPAVLKLTYYYTDQDEAELKRTAVATVTIPARGSLAPEVASDALAQLFGVTNRSYGWIRMEGDIGRVIANAAVSAQVDPLDPGKGLKTSQVEPVASTAPEVFGATDVARRFGGNEKSELKRTNVILVEVTGKEARVQLSVADGKGEIVALKSVTVPANGYFQINDIFGPSGTGLGAGPFYNMEVRAEVTEGAGKIVALATVNDNVSRNPEVFVFKKAGPPAGFSSVSPLAHPTLD